MQGDSASQQQIDDAVREISERRSVIDQAKGMLMFVFGISAEDAFDLLVLQSQQHNVKLRLLAEQIVGDLVELSRTTPTLDRLDCHGVLVTAHQRIAQVAAQPADGSPRPIDRSPR